MPDLLHLLLPLTAFVIVGYFAWYRRNRGPGLLLRWLLLITGGVLVLAIAEILRRH